MFKSWKAEKKIKAIFEMQFQATQVPLLKAKNLMVSLVPADVGKPTVKLDKAPIVEGNCTWKNPIYETVKLVRETKTGRFKERVYYLVVSTGSSRKSFLGEAYVDFADLAEANGLMMLSLPLQPTDSGAILNVTVHRIEPAQDDLRNGIHGYQMDESNGGCLEAEDHDCNVDSRSGVGSNEDRRCSEILPQYSKDIRERDPSMDRGSTTENSSHGLNYTPEKAGVNSENSNSYKQSDWSSESTSDSMMDITKGPEVNETSQNTIVRLENNIQVLERQAEFSELEIQSLRKQVAKENRREQELSKQISSLKDERDSFRTKYEQLKSVPDFVPEKDSFDPQAATEYLRSQLEDTKRGLQHEQHLNKKLRLKLQKAEDSNSEFILAIRDLNKRLNQKDTEILNVSEVYSDNDEAETLKEKIKELYTEIEEYNKDKEGLTTQVERISQKYEILNHENKNLQSDLDKTHIEMVNIQREHFESLSTAKWLRLQTEKLEKEIKTQELKYSESLEAINELETEITRLEKEMERQALEFQEHLEAVSQVNIEQENRARAAEDVLRTAKSDAAREVDRLNLELRKVSIDVSFKIDENEKIVTDAVAEAHDLRLQNQVLEELLEKMKGELSLMKELHERDLPDRNIHERKHQTNQSNETEVLAEAFSTGGKISQGGEIFELKERNRHMEVELKDMQDRYSDISLKFAEVEGERQQLVMTLRNMKRKS